MLAAISVARLLSDNRALIHPLTAEPTHQRRQSPPPKWDQGDFRKIYATRFEMVRQLVATEKEIQRLTAERSSLLAPIPDLKATKDIQGNSYARRRPHPINIATIAWSLKSHGVPRT
jgi:hypothetical protein